MKALFTIIVLLVVVAAAGAVFVWFGFFNVSARVPHWDITVEAIEVVRDRSIIVHSRDVKTPPMADPALVPKGIALYREACAALPRGAGDFGRSLCSGPLPGPGEPAVGIYTKRMERRATVLDRGKWPQNDRNARFRLKLRERGNSSHSSFCPADPQNEG